MDISQNFVAFSEYMNFMYTDRPKRISEKQQLSVLKQMDENCNPYVVGEKKILWSDQFECHTAAIQQQMALNFELY